MSGIKLKLLGAAKEVGRAGILASMDDVNVLLDYGVSLAEEEPGFPLHVKPRILDAVALSHAHLDHSGAIPLLYVSAGPPLLSTMLTATLSELLIRDFLKLSKYYVPYESSEVENMLQHLAVQEYGSAYEVNGVEIRFYDAGHIPGSAIISVDNGSWSLVYTGDFNLEPSCLLNGADLTPIRKADIVIMESTYAEYDHPPREKNEEAFISKLYEVLENGGTVLIPSFAVGRAQEILCVLAKHGFEFPVYLDGMAKTAGTIILEERGLLRSPELFEEAMSMAVKVRNWNMRKRIVEENAVIVSPAGMLKGGPSVYYMEKVMEKKENAVFFVSYLIPDTPGRKVIETGIFSSPTKKGVVNARVEWFDFSAHSGKTQLLETIESTKKNAKIVIVHGREEPELKLAKAAREKGRQAIIPSLGEETVFG